MNSHVLTLVPTRRLGGLLREAREASDLSLDELAADSPHFDVVDLREIEEGDRALNEAEREQVVALYPVDPDTMVPGRTDLVVDLAHHRLATADRTQPLAGPAPTADEVLSSYLSLVYALRCTTPGTRVPLRQADLDVLGRALTLATPEVEHRLVELMASPTPDLRRRSRLLRVRVLVPAAVLLAVTAVGALVVTTRIDDSRSSTPPAVVVPTGAQIDGAATRDAQPRRLGRAPRGPGRSPRRRQPPGGRGGPGRSAGGQRGGPTASRCRPIARRRTARPAPPRPRPDPSGLRSRSPVGHTTGVHDWLVAGALVEGPEGLLLVQNRRRNGSSDWSPPGGVIDEGESVLEGLAREVTEETGLVVTDWSETDLRDRGARPRPGLAAAGRGVPGPRAGRASW